jgi:ribonuclease-3
VVGKGMASHKAFPMSLAAGLLEAVIAAVYIDSGFETAQDFILRNFATFIDEIDSEEAHGNYKSLLQQHAQEQFNAAPNYVLLDE